MRSYLNKCFRLLTSLKLSVLLTSLWRSSITSFARHASKLCVYKWT